MTLGGFDGRRDYAVGRPLHSEVHRAVGREGPSLIHDGRTRPQKR